MEAENALLANIKQKGQNSYYYAHQPRTPVNAAEARVLEGEGIVNGGHPKLAEVIETIPVRETVVPIRIYSWADDTPKVTIIIPFPQGGLTEECVQIQLDKKSVDVAVRVREGEVHKLNLSPLSYDIVPEQSRIRVRPDRVTLSLKKEIEAKWFELVEAKKSDKGLWSGEDS